MRLVFAHADHETYNRARDRLIDQFLAWAPSRALAPDSTAAAAILDYKHRADGRLARWTCEDVTDVLTSWFPRTVTLAQDAWPSIAPTFDALIDFLVDRDLLDQRGATPAELHARIDASTPALLAGMADERQYDMGKFWGTQMLRHKVDLTDDHAVCEFVDAARAGRIDVDQEALYAILQRQFLQAEPPKQKHPDLPPVLLASDRELAAAAEASTTLHRLRELTVWVGDGRTMTSMERLQLADARELAERLDIDHQFLATARHSEDLPTVSLLLRWALAVRLVRKLKGQIVAVKRAAPLLRKPVELWQRAFSIMPSLGRDLFRGNVDLLFALALPEVVPLLWVSLYSTGRNAPIPVELLHSIANEFLVGRFGTTPDRFRSSIDIHQTRHPIASLLDEAELLGAVRIQSITNREQLAGIAEIVGRDDPDPRRVALTPLGVWGVQRVLLEEGVPAPLAGELAYEDIEYLCVRLAHSESDAIEQELDAWVAHRGPELAASELAAFVERTDDPTHRLLALQALTHTGEVGVETALNMRSRGGAAGAAATLWLIEHKVADPDSVTEQERMLALTESLIAVGENAAIVEVFDTLPANDQIRLLHKINDAGHPRLRTVLDAIADKHPDRTIAKIARKERFTLHRSPDH
ncbi:MAG: hypothetical protein ACR2GH_00565 [Pseudonocardia sp.]